MQFKSDLQYSSPDKFGEITIDKVGITDVKKKIAVHWDEGHHYWISPKISALIRLPKHQRGIHMSRSAEMIEECINLTLFKPVHSLEEFAKRILNKLMEMHEYTDHAEVSLAGDLILQIVEKDERSGQKPFEIKVNAEANRLENDSLSYKGNVGISAWGMTCCPCAQEMNREYIESIVESRKDINISKEQLSKLFQILPVASHNQRALGSIQIGFTNLDKEVMNVLDLIEVIESSMSGRIQAVLKRPQEAELVRKAHLNPVFAEDSIRRMAMQLAKKQFSDIPDGATVKISILSYESIHIHNVFAEITSTFKEIRAIASNGK
jgi:GTP cyclohydrolase IV